MKHLEENDDSYKCTSCIKGKKCNKKIQKKSAIVFMELKMTPTETCAGIACLEFEWHFEWKIELLNDYETSLFRLPKIYFAACDGFLSVWATDTRTGQENFAASILPSTPLVVATINFLFCQNKFIDSRGMICGPAKKLFSIPNQLFIPKNKKTAFRYIK